MERSSGSATAASPPPPEPLRLLLVTSRPALTERLRRRLAGEAVDLSAADAVLAGLVAEADAVLLDLPDAGDPAAVERAVAQARDLAETPVPVLVLGRPSRDGRLALYEAGVLGFADAEADPEELAARLASLAGAKRRAARAVKRLRDHSRRLDEQLRLAQRLQRDFLPRRLPGTTTGRFAARLEPAAWVAGDFYDIFRLDEQHVGFYVADAVGHGIPAALLTVFVKKSLQTKHIEGKHYDLIPPDEALRLLNRDLLSAELQETPFITLVYGHYNEVTREVVYARAGHPRPLLLGPRATLEPLEGEGPLLGIFPDADFEACRRRLEPGQRLLLYSDGAERVAPGRRSSPERLREVIQTAALLPVEAFLDAVLDAVRGATDGRRLADDVTLVALEVTGDEDES
ncbi:MAG: PP2C family protein-serine/threonine phosphatase [Phycisphaerae bacterium]